MSSTQSTGTSSSSSTKKAVDPSALTIVEKIIKSKKLRTQHFVGWVDKINQRDKKVLKRIVIVTSDMLLSVKPDGKIAREGKLTELKEVRSASVTQLYLVFKQFVLDMESNNTPLIVLTLRKVLAKSGLKPQFNVCKAVQTNAKTFDAVYSVKEGYLYKQGGKVKNWKSRWFVLNKTSINYFESEKDSKSNQKPLGTIMLSTIEKDTLATKSVSNPPHSAGFCFEFTASDRDWLFCATSEADRDQWIEAIRTCKSPPKPQTAARTMRSTKSSPNDLGPHHTQRHLQQQQQQQQQRHAVQHTLPRQALTPPPVSPRTQPPHTLRSGAPSKPQRQARPIPHDMIGLQAMFPNEPLSVLQAALNSVKQDYVRVVELLEVRDRQRTKQVLKNQQHVQTRQRRSSSVGDLPTDLAPTISDGRTPMPVFRRARSPSEEALAAATAQRDAGQPLHRTMSGGGAVIYDSLPSAPKKNLVYDELPPQTRMMTTPAPTQQPAGQVNYTTLGAAPDLGLTPQF